MKVYLIIILLVAGVLAQAPPLHSPLEKTSTTGDSPLSLFDSREGNYGYMILPVAYNNAKTMADSFSLDVLPAGASLTRAWYVVTDWRVDTSSVTTIIAMDTLQIDTAFYDPATGNVLSTFVYDVTSRIVAKNLKTHVEGLNNSYLSFLYLVYEDASLPRAQIDFYLGSEALQNDSSSIIVQSSQAYHGVQIGVLTEAADSSSSDKENIFLNGNPLADTGLFYGNLGKYADYYQIDSLTINKGLNHIAVQTGQDYFGYHALVYSHHFDAVSALEPPLVHFPKTFELLPNFPNPFNPSTEIRYRLKRPAHVSLDIFDITGRHVRSFDLGKQSSGMRRFIFNAHGLATGVYYYRLTVGNIQKSRRMILLQ